MKKVIFVICDGLGDRPIPELNNQTPLEAAKTPNLDHLVQKGISGAMHAVDIGIRPGSDTSHLAIFGYDPYTYYTGRGPFEVAGAGLELKTGDVAFRVNMGTVDENLNVVDRRAGRIDDTSEFADMFNGTKIDGVEFILKSSIGHRVAMIMRGENLSGDISDCDPHIENAKIKLSQPTKDTPEAKRTAEVLNKFLDMTYQRLKDLPTNKKRQEQGLLPANYFLVRGAGIMPEMPSFKQKYNLNSACIAGGALYRGIAKIVGMDVIDLDPQATGKPDSNLKVKVDKLIEIYNDYDFFLLHFKGTDTLGEDGDWQGKKDFIENKIDPALKPLLDLENSLIVVTADHSTPCALKAHSADDVPITIYSQGIRDDDVEHFNERECARGRLGHIQGRHVMPIVIDLMGLASMFGA
ncbi:MAG: 2,3-bisphosphoglycerate-independent phosphoglycerate mutase [Patescibacteria group bacterium]|nr:2,3-bisphosphoglycerate-independent phosphoglycerate mutase [Patescibacteria group bacterium]